MVHRVLSGLWVFASTSWLKEMKWEPACWWKPVGIVRVSVAHVPPYCALLRSSSSLCDWRLFNGITARESGGSALALDLKASLEICFFVSSFLTDVIHMGAVQWLPLANSSIFPPPRKKPHTY